MSRQTDREEWLKKVHEEALEPRLPICDPHHHLWDGPGNRGTYLADDFLRDVADSGHRVEKTVFVECGMGYRKEGPEEMRPVGETQFVESITAKPFLCGERNVRLASGIVGFVDLTLGAAAAPVLEAHMEAGKGRLRGVRQSCTWDPDPSIISLAKEAGMMQNGAFREGFAHLSAYGLLFDAWQYYTQLSDLAELAADFPDTTIVVNHAGGPLGIGRHAGRNDEVAEAWKRGIRALASRPNVAMKLGGLGMPRCGFGWRERRKPPTSTELAAVIEPYYRFCIEAFGAQRCMFESNFPVDRESYPYSVLWNAFKRVCEGFSEGEKGALFYGTAMRVYGLENEDRA